MPVIEKFVCWINGSNSHSVDKLRLEQFATSATDNFRELPPTQDSLYLHVKRSCYQAGWVWGNTFSQRECPDLTTMGWVIEEGSLHVQWTTQPTSFGQKVLTDLIKTCKCRSATCSSCGCKRGGKQCLIHCNCQGKCGTNSNDEWNDFFLINFPFVVLCLFTKINLFFSRFVRAQEQVSTTYQTLKFWQFMFTFEKCFERISRKENVLDPMFVNKSNINLYIPVRLSLRTSLYDSPIKS